MNLDTAKSAVSLLSDFYPKKTFQISEEPGQSGVILPNDMATSVGASVALVTILRLLEASDSKHKNELRNLIDEAVPEVIKELPARLQKKDEDGQVIIW